MESAQFPAETNLAGFVKLCGSKRSAAKAIGVPRKTLCRWLLDIERTGKINARPSRVRGAMERINAVRANMRQDAPCYDVADAFMSVFGFQRAGRGDDMTCASIPGDYSGMNNCGASLPDDFATSAFATTQGTNTETVQRLMRESVHKSRIADGKERKLDGWKDILLVSDMHCGHSVGLTPPGRWQGEDYEIQREVWEFYEREVNAHGPYDACFDLGDNIDGRGSKSGGTELITNDLLDQTDIATQCLLAIPTDKFYMVYGTPYHVSVEGTDMERQISDNLKLRGKEVTISGHEWIDVNGCVFDIKHKVGSSGTPYGRHTAISKARIWNDMWALRNMAPRADVFCRGHVHYHVDCGGVRNGRPWRAMTLPALQGPGSKFGVRQCEGEVNFGFVVFHVSPEGKFTWDVHEFQPKAGQPIARVL